MKSIITVLAVLLFSAYSMAPYQTRVISGIVKDEAGNPLPGVSVVEKGTSNGTVTDLNGAYQISVGTEARYLLFTYIGMEQVEVRIARSNRINVIMKHANLVLDEVVFTEAEPVKSYEMKAADMAVQRPGRPIMMKVGGRTKRAHMATSYAPEAGFIQHNTEGYSTIHENGFKDVLHAPLSTFSIDVDKASYSNVRRFLNMGQLPPKDAVRIEEMINYFNYDYPEPKGKHPFSVYTEISSCPWNENHQLLHVGLKGKSIDKSELPPSNLVLLIDVAGDNRQRRKTIKSGTALMTGPDPVAQGAIDLDPRHQILDGTGGQGEAIDRVID